MKIFCVFPKQTGTRPVHVTIPKRYVYFWEIVTYLSQKFDVSSLDCIDPKTSTSDIGRKVLAERPELIVCLCRIDNLEQTLKLATFLKSLAPESKIIVYGDVVNLVPRFFKEQGQFDAVVTSGDWEFSIEEYARYISKEGHVPRGVYVRETGSELPGLYLANWWTFPDTDNPIFPLYDEINGRRQISLTIARGCPFNCSFCLSVKTFGAAERRKSVDDVARFINEHRERYDSFKLFAPTFTLDGQWVKDFANQLIGDGHKVSWTATSRIDCLKDEELIGKMAEAGCYKISVGIETINDSAVFLNKRFAKKDIERVATAFRKHNMILKGLIMLGVPGQTKADILELFEFMERNSIIIRPTSYSPLNEIKNADSLSLEEIQKYDKLTYYKYGIEGISQTNYYRLILDPYSYRDILG